MTLRPTIKKHPRPGRPSNDPSQADFRANPLYGKLVNAFPQFVKTDESDWRKTELNVSDLADYLGYHRYAVYRWLNGKAMRPKAASTLVDKSNGAITFEDLHANLF